MRLRFVLASIILLILPWRGVSGQSTHAPSDGGKHSAAAAFEEGQNAQQRGDLNSAVRFYTTAISADGSLFQAYYQRATALLGLGREAEAQADLKKVTELQPGFARAHRGLGQMLLDRGQIEDAKRSLARAIELEPKLTGVRVYYASALLRSGEPQRAIEHLRVAIEQREEVTLAYALVGVAEERLGKTAEAFADYSRALELDANNATAHEGRARLFEARGETAKAIEDYSAAYRAQPSRDLAVKLAELHTRAGQTQAAIQLYRRLLLEKPDDLAIRVEMACLMGENGQGEEGEKEIARVVAVKPKDSKLLARAGDFFFKEKPAQAADYYKRSLEADPKNNRARVQLGASLVRSMQIEAAMPVLTDAISREPDNYAAHASLATALFKQKQYVEAAGEFIWIIRVRPEVSASYYFLAISFDHLGDCEQASRAYQEFVRRADPAAYKSEIEEANARSSQLQRLIKGKKCIPAAKKRDQKREMNVSVSDTETNRVKSISEYRLALAVFVFVVVIANSQTLRAQIPEPPLPVDPRPLSQLITAADKAVLADSDNPKELVEAYLKISDSHLQAAANAIRANNHLAAEMELDIYNKAVAAAGKEAFARQDGKRSMSKRIEQTLYKQIKTLETIGRLFPSDREMFAEAALKQTKQLRMQALNEAFDSGEVLKDPDVDKKPKSEPPAYDGALLKFAPPNSTARAGLIQTTVGIRGFSVLPGGLLFSASTRLVNASFFKPSRVWLQQRGDYLTEEEDNHVREAQAPDARAKVFMKIADRRLRGIVGAAAPPTDKKDQKKAEEEEREWGALPKVSREEFLRHYARAIAECMAKLEDAYERNPKSSALPKALSVLRDATDKHLETLRRLKPEMTTETELTAISGAIYEAEIANKGARDGLK